MTLHPDKSLIHTNKLLGQQPTLFFLPANQIIPWAILIVASYVITLGFFDFGLWAFLVVSIWLCLTWLLLTGKHPYLFIDKFIFPPGKDWYSAKLPYISPFINKRSNQIRKQFKDSELIPKIKPRTGRNQNGQVNRYMAFQNFHNIVSLVSIEKNGQSVTGLLLNQGTKYQIVFPFRTDGYHNNLEDTEITNFAETITEGLKELPETEKITICTRKFSDSNKREKELSKIADNCKLKSLAVLCRNEQKVVKELTEKGIRQLWETTIFCTWTYDQITGQNSSDIISKFIRLVGNKYNKFISKLSGSKEIYQKEFYKELIINSFDKGFNNWENLLNTRLGLNAKSLTVEETWSWLWYRYNSPKTKLPPVPQVITVRESNEQVEIDEIVNNDKHIITVLTEGKTESTCPEHRQSQDTIWLPGKNQKCGVLTLTEKPSSPMTPREQLKWIYKVLSKEYVKDTETIIELTAANSHLVEESLSRIAKQSQTAQIRSLEKGAGKDAGAIINEEETFRAKKQLRQGGKCFHIGFVVLVYRQNPKELDLACNKLCSSFGTAKIQRERNIAWSIWVSTLPTNMSRILQSNSALEDRRQILSNETAWRFFPLTISKNIDRKGVELISSSGKPIYLDLCHEQTNRALILGTSGSGKSVLAWQFILDHLRSDIPVIGMDVSTGQGSSFKTAIELLGDDGAYYDIKKHSNNLLEPPDLRNFQDEERKIRLDQWLNSVQIAIVEIAMGRVDHPHLKQRVTSLVTKTTNNFISDSEIISRYNNAFVQSWKSEAWQKMPVLADWLKFCSKEKLDLQKFEEIDKQAINQIHRQIDSLLKSPLGKAVGKPSSFSPNPKIKFFALSGLDNEHEQSIIALTCQAACMRNALTYPKSLIVGDELSVLFKKDGFADCFGNLCAVGRKSGISLILISQDIDAIQNCSASEQILQNINYKVIGRITSSGANSLTRYLKYDPRIINQNYSELYKPNKSTLASKWLIETNSRFWQASYYPSPMTLASVANSTDESKAREIIMKKHQQNTIGKLKALKQFSQIYIQSIQQQQNILELVKK